MLEEVTSDILTEVGAADGAIHVRGSELRREKLGSMRLLTSSHCGGCEVVFSCLAITQYCSHSDGVLSGLLQLSQCVHCLTSSITRNGIRGSETLSVVSVGVGDGVASCHTIHKVQCNSHRCSG